MLPAGIFGDQGGGAVYSAFCIQVQENKKCMVEANPGFNTGFEVGLCAQL